MYKTASKDEIGIHLKELILSKGYNYRQFAIEFLKKRDGIKEPTEDQKANISNKISQILNGNKSVQLEDLPALSELLDVSIEEIISAGNYTVPKVDRKTNYSISISKDPKEWESYINRADKLILNPDEYNKTVIDYALENGNYKFLKFLLDKQYIWFVSENQDDYCAFSFGAGTSIKRRDVGYMDTLDIKLKDIGSDDLRFKMISLAINNNDTKLLSSLHAREIPELYSITPTLYHHNLNGKKLPVTKNVEAMIRSIAASNDKTIDYFFEEFDIHPKYTTTASTFVFPYAGLLLKELIKTKPEKAKDMLEKAIKHNKDLQKRLLASVDKCTNDYLDTLDWYKSSDSDSKKQLEEEYKKDTWRDYYFYPESGFMIFVERSLTEGSPITGIVSNIIYVNAKTTNKSIQPLINELTATFDKFKDYSKN